MADELKPVQDGETETAAADTDLPETTEETDSPAAEDAAAETDSSEKTADDAPDETAQKALDELESLNDKTDSGEDPDAELAEFLGSSGKSASAALGAFKEKAAGLAGAMKEKAGKLSDEMKENARKKQEEKKLANKRTVEEELADLAEEEKQFDDWGRPIRKKRARRRKKSRKLSCTLVLLTLILALASVLSVAILAVAKEMYGIDKNVQKRIITIPDGTSPADIALLLQDEHMISLPQVFRLVSRMNGMDSKYIAGEHTLTASMAYEAMIEELCTNHADERESQRVLIREGTTLVDAAKILQENEICDAEKFLFFFNKGGYGFKFEEYLPAKNSLKWQQMEGYCFPDTYEFYVGEEPVIVAQKIYANFDSKLREGDYKKMDELGLTLDEVITLASMVQGEASRTDYMKMVASVFMNRYHHKAEYPRFESDPTRKYAELIAENLIISNDTMTTAYNTYKGAGLPPGAINNPGRAAIEAVLYPAQTNYFFFNSNIDTGETFFAETYEQHKQNLAIVDGQYAAAKAAANG
jgi:UPF0755 protein